MEFEVLGPLRMRDEGVSFLPSRPRIRRLLALLLVNANNLVSIDTCAQEIWGPQPEHDSTPAIKTYVAGIRKAISSCPSVTSSAAARRILVCGSSGYLLVIRPESLDMTQFMSRVEQARSAQRIGDDRLTSLAYRRALALWQGPALADVPAGLHLRRSVGELEQTRLAAVEACFDAELRLGRHLELLPELARFAVHHPTHQNLQARYMLALYRAGRREQALGVFQRLRQTLLRTTATEPAAPVVRLRDAILNADPAIDVPTAHP